MADLKGSLDQMDKAEFPMVDVLRVRHAGGHRLSIRFSTGEEGVWDFGAMVAGSGAMVEPLRDISYFARVFVEMGAPTWPNGYDVDSIKLYMDMRDAHTLSHTMAAE